MCGASVGFVIKGDTVVYYETWLCRFRFFEWKNFINRNFYFIFHSFIRARSFERERLSRERRRKRQRFHQGFYFIHVDFNCLCYSDEELVLFCWDHDKTLIDIMF